MSYFYYNSGTALGIVGVSIQDIKHSENGYTFIVGRTSEYSWIKTKDLFKTREEAKQSKPAEFYGKRI